MSSIDSIRLRGKNIGPFESFDPELYSINYVKNAEFLIIPSVSMKIIAHFQLKDLCFNGNINNYEEG